MVSLTNDVLGHDHDSASDESQRSSPTIDSSLISARQTPNAGFGVFAENDLAPHTELLRSSSPAAYVIYRQFRKEVCAWCFRYDLGRTWKVRLSESDLKTSQEGEPDPSLPEGDSGKTGKPRRVSGSFNGGGMVFDSESCRDSWLEEYGTIGLECFTSVEAFVQKQSRKRDEDREDGERVSKVPPTPKDIDQVSSSVRLKLLRFKTTRERALDSRVDPKDAGEFEGLCKLRVGRSRWYEDGRG